MLLWNVVINVLLIERIFVEAKFDWMESDYSECGIECGWDFFRNMEWSDGRKMQGVRK